MCCADADSVADTDSPTKSSSRLNKSEFEKIYQSGKRFHGSFCRLIVCQGYGRQAFATSRQIGSKPVRNRVKRRLREICRRLPASEWMSADVILVAMVSAKDTSFPELTTDVNQLFDRALKWVKNLESS